MKNSRLLCLYHPTTAVIIDDDEIFLRNMELKLDLNIPCKTYQDPSLALDDLKQLKTQNQFLSHTITMSSGSHSEEGKFPVDFNIAAIYQEVYDNKQFSEVSVVVVDYSMPQMSGAEFLERLIDTPVKKIMLTGQADESFAVKLFNRGVIDKFILKSAESLQQTLNESIYELQRKYFQDLSDIILKALAGQLGSCFTDPIFIQFFEQTLAQTATSSYYLIEKSGSYLLLDADNRPTWLLVKTKDEMLEFSQQAQTEGAAQNVVESIKNGEKIAYFSNFSQYIEATNGYWDKYLYPAKELKGEKTYCYALIKDLPGFLLDREKILSFNEFLHGNISK